jgi:multidrug efflux system outer membrane protein
MEIPMKTMTLVPLLAALVLAGCATAVPQLPADAPAPARFKDAGPSWTVAAPAESQDRGAWWKVFADPALEALVERADIHNAGVQEAAARLAQARAIARSVDADRAPQVGVGAGVGRQAGANTVNGATPATLATAGASLAYEVDLFGRLSHASSAARLDVQAQEALLQSSRLLVQAEVAQTYLALRALDSERALVAETVADYRVTLELTRRRQRAGDLAELDVARVETELAANESDALALERQRTRLETALAVLVGDAASDFTLPAVDWSATLPQIPAGIPATVLARRPDVAAAQSAMLAAQARVGVARAAWFPSLSLTAAGGYASPELGDLFKWSARAWSVGALLSLPVFDGGRREANERGAMAQLDVELARHRGQVLLAFKDVEDQLAALRLLQQEAQTQARAVSFAKRATTLSESRYRNGMDSQLELLDARRSELRNRRDELHVRSSQYQATVGLIRALGGSWDAERTGEAPGAVPRG